MIINERNFGEVVAKLLRVASEYPKIERYDTCGITFNKKERCLKIINSFAFVRVDNVDIEINISEDKPFYNVLTKEWTRNPYPADPDFFMSKRAETYNFVGKTEYYGTNILNILNKDIDKVLQGRARYVFVQGYLPQGCAIITFKDENGRPVFRHPKLDKEFVISENSTIPEEFINVGTSYICALDQCGDRINLDVLAKFGKTRSGMFVSEVKYDAKCLPRLNNLEIVHPDLTCCSNVLEPEEQGKELISMPPIHVGAVLLYDLLKVLLLCKSTRFTLHYQEEVNKDIFIESMPVDDDDVKVQIFFPPLDIHKTIQRG